MMRWLWWWRPPCLLRQVILNLEGDSTSALQGVLWSARGPWVTLRQPSMLKSGQPPIPMDGEVVVHRAKVAFLQVLP
jgi:hypothetical protein